MKRCLPWGHPSHSPGRLSKGGYLHGFFLLFIFYALPAFAQQRITVTGRVMAADSAVAGATVQVKGSKEAVQTAPDGRFSINVPKGSRLVITNVGYAPQEIAASPTFMVVQLNQAVQQGSEVIVVGYGVQKKATLTGSISQEAGSEIAVSRSPTSAHRWRASCRASSLTRLMANREGMIRISLSGAWLRYRPLTPMPR